MAKRGRPKLPPGKKGRYHRRTSLPPEDPPTINDQEVVESTYATTTPRPKNTVPLGEKWERMCLANIYDVKNGLASILRDLMSEKITDDRARVMIYGLTSMAKLIQDHELEKRIAELEKSSGASTPILLTPTTEPSDEIPAQ